MKRLFLASIIILLLVSCASFRVVSDSNDTATSIYYEVLLESEESVENRYNFIYYLYSEDSLERVITEAEKALSIYPDYTRFLKIEALAYRELDNKEEYSKTLKRVIEKEPYDEELRDLYLDSLLALEDKETALTFSKETIILFPENEKAISVLAENSDFYTYLDSINKEKEEKEAEEKAKIEAEEAKKEAEEAEQGTEKEDITTPDKPEEPATPTEAIPPENESLAPEKPEEPAPPEIGATPQEPAQEEKEQN